MQVQGGQNGTKRSKRRVLVDRAALWTNVGEPLVQARIEDESASGIGFRISRNVLRPGQIVHVYRRKDAQTRRARVARIECRGHDGSAVGCTWLNERPRTTQNTSPITVR